MPYNLNEMPYNLNYKASCFLYICFVPDVVLTEEIGGGFLHTTNALSAVINIMKVLKATFLDFLCDV